MSDNQKIENLQKALFNQKGLNPLAGLKPNLDQFSQNTSESTLKLKLNQNNLRDSKNNSKSLQDPKGINKQVLKGNSKARKN